MRGRKPPLFFCSGFLILSKGCAASLRKRRVSSIFAKRIFGKLLLERDEKRVDQIVRIRDSREPENSRVFLAFSKVCVRFRPMHQGRGRRGSCSFFCSVVCFSFLFCFSPFNIFFLKHRAASFFFWVGSVAVYRHCSLFFTFSIHMIFNIFFTIIYHVSSI